MSLKKSQLSALIAVFSGAATLLPAAVSAQNVEEEVVVTGFRKSLEAALDTKRASANNTDSIIAEDIGKMPDLNLAESLQRLPGVAITREGGEGRQITVRGLGPDYTRTTLNGMEVPGSTGGLDSSGGVNRGRAFDFNIFPSELFKQMTLAKSTTAGIEEGGLAATVELYSFRPLDNPGFNLSVSGQGTVDSFAGELDPRLTAIYSQTFFDDKLGIMAAVAQSQRTVRQEGFGTVRWTSPFSNGDRSWVGTDADVDIVGTPNPGANYPGVSGGAEQLDYMWHPRLPRMDSFNREQDRLGYAFTAQFQPTDRMEFALDVVGSQLDADVTSYNYFAQFRNLQDTIEPTRVVLDSSGRYIVAGDFNNVSPRSESRGQFSETDFLQVVASGKFDLTDSMTLDVQYGEAKSDHEEYQYRYNLTASEASTFSYSFEKNENIAEMSYGFDILDPANYGWSGPTFREDIVERKNKTFKADLTIEGDGSDVSFGMIWNDRNLNSERGNPVNLNDDIPAPNADLTNSLSDVVSGYADGLDAPSGFPRNFIVADYDAATAAYGAGEFETALGDSNTYNVTEETLGGYMEVNSDAELLGKPLRVNAGLRVVQTTVTSKGVVDDGDGGFVPTELERDYTEWLPSTNLVWEFQDDLLFRLNMNRNFTRPGLSSMAGNVEVTPINGNVSVGNPGLDPERANSVDMSVEWYFADESVLSFTYFYKQIESFITGATLEGVELPADIREIVAARPEYDPSSPLYDESVLSPDSDDWNITTSVNGEGAELDGYEIGYQQPFTFLPGWADNFGAFANYTYVDSQAEYGNGVVGTLEGLSKNSYNLGLYYENDTFGARAVINSRDDYVTDQTGSNGNSSHGTTGPTRVDLSGYWNATEWLKVTLEVINATNEPERLYTTGPEGDLDLIREYNTTGTEVLLGVRATF